MKLQKILALLLALMMVFALAACGGDDSEKKDEESAEPTLVGQWNSHSTVPFDSGIKESNLKLAAVMQYDFRADGTAYISVDEDSMRRHLKDQESALKAALAAIADDVDTAYTQYCDELLETLSQNVDGTWTLDGNALTLKFDGEETAYTVKFDGKDLILSGGDIAEVFGTNEVRFSPAN